MSRRPNAMDTIDAARCVPTCRSCSRPVYSALFADREKSRAEPLPCARSCRPSRLIVSLCTAEDVLALPPSRMPSLLLVVLPVPALGRCEGGEHLDAS